MDLVIHLADEAATLRAGATVAEIALPGAWIALEGPLGAGKTTLARGIARGLGLDEEVPVTSPTFALVQEYETRPRFVHGDLYRLTHPSELEPLGLLEALDEGAVMALEWALPFRAELGEPELLLRLSHHEDGGRGLVVEGRGRERFVVALRAAVARDPSL